MDGLDALLRRLTSTINRLDRVSGQHSVQIESLNKRVNAMDKAPQNRMTERETSDEIMMKDIVQRAQPIDEQQKIDEDELARLLETPVHKSRGRSRSRHSQRQKQPDSRAMSDDDFEELLGKISDQNTHDGKQSDADDLLAFFEKERY